MSTESEGGLPQGERDPETPPEKLESDGHENEAGDAEKEPVEPASSGDDPDDDVPKGVKKRIQRAVRDRDVERGLRAEAESRAERAEAELARVRGGGAEPKPGEQKPETKRDEPVARRDAVEWKTKVDDFKDDGEEKYDDFIDVVDNPRVQITKTMAEAMMDTDNGVDVAYYLGKNPKEARRIAALGESAQAREIGKLEVIVAAEAKKAAPVKTTKTPRPIEPVTGAKVSFKGLRADSSMDDFIKATR